MITPGPKRFLTFVLLALALALQALYLHAATVQYVYDELGRLIWVVDERNQLTQYEYDEVGNIVAVTRKAPGQVSIITFAPRHGEAGTSVEITGGGFSSSGSQNTVRFSGLAASVVSATPTSITAIVPVGATTGVITIETPNGSATSSENFTVDIPLPPKLIEFSPVVAIPGQSISILGEQIRPVVADNQVKINTTSASVTSVSAPTGITATVPVASGGKVSLATPFGTATSTQDLFIVPAPYSASQVEDKGRIVINQPTPRNILLQEGKIALLLFEGTAGLSNLHIGIDRPSANVSVTVYQPNGTQFGTKTTFGSQGGSLDLPALPATGTYTALVRFENGIGTTALSIWAGDILTGTLTVNVPKGVTFNSPSDQGSFTFAGTRGEVLGLGVTSDTFVGAVVQIYQPGNDSTPWRVISGRIGDLAQRLSPLPATGIYRLTIRPLTGANAQPVGVLRLTLWKDIAATLVENNAFELRLNLRQLITLAFQPSQGDGFSLRFSGKPEDPYLLLAQTRYPSGASSEAYFIGTGGAFGVRDQPLNGSYRSELGALLQPKDAISVTANTWSDVRENLNIGVPHVLKIVHAAQQGRLSFTGIVGQSLALNISDATLPVGTNITVLNPSGNQVASGTTSQTGLILNISPLVSSGIYVVQITPSLLGIGQATLRLTER